MRSSLNKELKKFDFLTLDVETVLGTALKRGGELAEMFFEETVSTRVFYEKGRVDRLMDRGVGLRIIFQGRSVYGYTTDLTERALITLAETLSEANSGVRQGSSKLSVEWRMAQQSSVEIDRYRIQESPRDISLSQKIELARRAELAARVELPSARQVTAVVMDSQRKILVLNSDGLIAPDSKTYLQAVV